MKASNANLEILLIAITFLLGICSIESEDSRVQGLAWLILLGLLQVTHSIGIAYFHWENIKIRNAIIIYWLGVLVNFIFIPFNKLPQNGNTFLEILALLALPLSLAIYLLWITCYFSEKKTDNKV